MLKTTVTGAEAAKEAIQRELRKLMTDRFVLVGIHQDDNNRDSNDITNASLGAIHEFGADVRHPGGTSYGYASKAAAERGEVRFLKTGKGYLELGVTGPHVINIPARPWLVPGVRSADDQYLQIIQKGIADNTPMEQILNRLGIVAAGAVQKYMTDLKTPPNAPSTIKQKGSSNPLIKDGALRQSVTYSINSGKPEEGL